MRHKELGLWQPITWEEYAHRVRLVANGLLALGLNYGDRVGLIGENRPEWLYADLGIQAAGGVTAAIYATNSADQCAYILSHSESRFWFVEDEEQLDKYLEVRHQLPHLERVIVIDPEGLRDFYDEQVMTLEELERLGADYAARHPHALNERLEQGKPDDVALLIYTSGTTGPPKGAMLTHRNCLWTADALARANPIRADEKTLSFLPLSHIAQRMVSVYLTLYWGLTVHFCENTDTGLENMREVSPTLIFAVPRIWQKLHPRVELAIQDADWFKRGAYRLATAIGRRHARARLYEGRASPGLSALYWLARVLVLRPLT